jgi:hypothetical protein
MSSAWMVRLIGLSVLVIASQYSAQAQEASQAVASADMAASDVGAPLTEDALEILIARIALYPDELVAVISAASLFPLQVVEAARFLEKHERDASLQPKETWDGSVISLLNYPEIVRMMSDDLEWTQALGEAISYQQKDVLIAIQQLREQAVAEGIIQSDDKVTVVNEGDNVVIQSASTEAVYVPQYEPEMLYVPDYPVVPIAYYPDPYPNYYYPTAPFFAGFVTGAIWGAVVDWDDWDVRGGNWNGGDIDIDCNNCFNDIDIDGKININDVDWKNVDRDKISIDRDQFNRIDRTSIKNSIEANDNNSIRNKVAEIKRDRPTTLPGQTGKLKDVRTSTLEGLKARPAPRNLSEVRPRPQQRPGQASRPAVSKPVKVDRPAKKPKMAAKPDKRPKKPSGFGEVKRGKTSKIHSKRGAKSSKPFIPKGGGRRGGGGRRR